jgi:zona occludens toxin (predicted ATPase)
MKTFFHEIAPYQIHATGMRFTVLPMEDGVYRVIQEGKLVADLYPEITAAGIFWNGFGQVPIQVADEIGKQIYAHEI